MDDDEHVVLVDEKVIIEEEEEMQEDEDVTERRTIRHSNDDDVLQVAVEDEELELKEVEENAPAPMDDASLEDGEVEEKKKTHKTLRSHLPDILQGIDEEDEFAGANTENLEKLRLRAKKFGLPDVELISPDEANKILLSLDVPLDEREKKYEGKYYLNYVEMYGVFALSNEDILDYFGQFDLQPTEIEEVSDDAVFVKFASKVAAFKALDKLSKPIGERRKEQKIIKHVLTADGSSPERKVITQDNTEEYDKTVNPADIGIDMPEGTWRYGKQHKKARAILMRFPLKAAFRKGHYLQNDNRRQYSIEPPREAVEMEKEERESNKNFDRKNPWGNLSERWARTGVSDGKREYEIPNDALDHPPIRLAAGRRDWDNPSEPDHPVQIRENRKRKFEDKVETYFEADEEIIESDTESGEEPDMKWGSKLKRPRLGMVADIEEAKNVQGVKGRLLGGHQQAVTKPKKKTISNLKRRISNNYVVEEKFVIESSGSEDDLNDSGLIREAQNADLRHHLTMRVENTSARPILKPSRRLGSRFGGATERSESEGEDRNYTFENMKIQIRQSSSEDERMQVDEQPTDIRHKIKQKREARERTEAKAAEPTESVDLRNRMSRHRQNSSPDQRPRHRQTERASGAAPDDLRTRMTGKARVKNEYEEEKRKEEQKRARTKAATKEDIEEDIEEKIHELESVKEMEKALLDKLNNKLKRMEKDKQELKTKSRDNREQSRVSRDKTRREPTAPSSRETTRREVGSASSRQDKRREQVSASRDVDRRRRSKERREITDKSRDHADKSRDLADKPRDLTDKPRGRGRHDSPARKKKPSRRRAKSSSSEDSSSSDSDDSSSSSDSDNSSSDESSSSSSSSDSQSSSSSSGSDSSSEDSSPERKKKSKNGRSSKPSSGKQDKNRKSTGGSSSRPASGKSTNKKSAKTDEKSSKSSKNNPEDKKKDADLKAKLQNFVTKTKTKKDKK